MTVDINEHIPDDFYIGIECRNCAFGNFPDSEYCAKAFDSRNTISVPVGETKYFHAYTVHMECMIDDVAYNYDVSENYIRIYDEAITDSHLEINGINTVIDLPNNRVYKITQSVPESFGLPSEAIGNNCTLLKYTPEKSSAENPGYCVYELTILRHWNTIKYFAYAIMGQAIDTLLWHKFNTTRINKGLADVGLTPLNIVLLGDSIVEGYGSSDYSSTGDKISNNVKEAHRNVGKLCWGNKFVDYMTSNYAGCSVVNNGIGGFTCQQVYENLDNLVPVNTDVVILSVGTNDRNASDKGVAITNYVRKILLHLLEKGIQPILLTNTPLMNTIAPNNAGTIKSAIIKAANDCDVVCYDVYGNFNYYLWEHNIDIGNAMNDDLHPNDLGYDIMFNIIRKELGV